MRNYRLTDKNRINIIVFSVSVFLYLLNRILLKNVTEGLIHWFLVCYWNDISGAVAFSAFVHEVIYYYTKKEIHLWGISIILLIAGLFWELITPLFRTNSVCDFWDIVAYESGGIIYYLSIRFLKKHSPKVKI